tara:strand:- start:41 stop:529 length:489 start_codon:yes stop_codon:yes gene_type:complete
MDDKKKKIAKAVAKKIPGVGPALSGYSIANALRQIARNKKDMVPYKEFVKPKPTKTQKAQRKLEIKRNLKNKYGTADPKLIKKIKKNREILAREKLKKDEKLKNMQPFTSGNKGQAAWGGHGASSKKFRSLYGTKYKKGGRVGGKCKVDGIAIRGRTRAKHK